MDETPLSRRILPIDAKTFQCPDCAPVFQPSGHLPNSWFSRQAFRTGAPLGMVRADAEIGK
jgi:hypothetical protein